MIPGFPFWGWAIIAVIGGGGLVWYVLGALKQAKLDAIRNAGLEAQAKADAIADADAKAIREAGAAEKAKTGPVTPADWKF